MIDMSNLWGIQGKRKRAPVVSCQLSRPGLPCAVIVGSVWAIWCSSGPVQIQLASLQMTTSTEQRRARHGGCRLLFCGAGFQWMLRCRFGGTFRSLRRWYAAKYLRTHPLITLTRRPGQPCWFWFCLCRGGSSLGHPRTCASS